MNKWFEFEGSGGKVTILISRIISIMENEDDNDIVEVFADEGGETAASYNSSESFNELKRRLYEQS